MTIEANTVSQFSGFAALRRFAPKEIPGEHCDLCSLRIGAHHRHLLELSSRQIVCACEACAILFNQQGKYRYKQIPRSSQLLADFHLSDSDWESFRIPIGLAFFFHQDDDDGPKVKGFYPSPAGATECLLDLSAWRDLAAANPILDRMQADVEALLVNRIGDARDFYLVPIDECYKLVGLIRTSWRGLSGGQEVWTRIDQFFRELQPGRREMAETNART